MVTDPLTPEQLAAIDRLVELAAEELRKRPQYPGCFHDKEFQLLSGVANWAARVKADHANPYARHAIEGSLENLRNVAKHFKFNLKESR